MDTHEIYVSLETAKLLKEAGFDWETFTVYIGEDETLPSRYSENTFNWNIPKNTYELEGSDHWFYRFINQKDTTNFYSAPTVDVAQRWLREVKNVRVDVDSLHLLRAGGKYIVRWSKLPCTIWKDSKNGERYEYDTYEEAQETGIKQVLEVILEKVNARD